MAKFLRFWSRALIVWVILIAIFAAFFVDYIEIVYCVGLVVVMGSFLIFAVNRVVRMLRNQPLSGMEDPVSPSTMMHVAAKMTGKTNRVSFIPRGNPRVEYTEYEITYSAKGKTYHKWFNMYPGPDLGDSYEAGCDVLIACDYDNPDHFEVLKIGDVTDEL